jgi:hypothetical protein
VTGGQLELQHGTIFVYLQSFAMYAKFPSFQQKALDLGASCDAFTLRKLCEFDWPLFDVGWPAEGPLICLQPMGSSPDGPATQARFLTF